MFLPFPPPPIVNGCFRNHVDSKLLTMEQEGFPIYYGQTPVTTHAVAANSVLAIFPPSSPFPRTLHKFQSLMSRPPNCYIQFELCSCGSVHGFLTSLIELDATAPLYVGDPPLDHLDFVIHFDGGAFREHRVGGAGIVLWKHTTQGLELLDTLAVPLFSCPDAAYAETVGAAHAVLMAARHFPLHRPSLYHYQGRQSSYHRFYELRGQASSYGPPASPYRCTARSCVLPAPDYVELYSA